MADSDSFKAEILESFKNVKVEKIDGTKYQSWISPNPPTVMYSMMKNTKIRQSDVIATGFPRSGNHWAYDVVHMVLNQTSEFATVPFVNCFWEFRDQAGFDALEATEAPRQLVTHARPRRFPSNTFELRPKMIFILRNPKDVVVSIYKCISKFTDEDMVYKGTWDQFFELFMMGEYTWGTWFDHTKALEKVMTDYPEIPIHIHQYEEMIKNPVAMIKKLCHFLGQPDDLADRIAEVTVFENMKAKNKNHFTVDQQFFGEKPQGSLMGQGIIGSWKNMFTVAQSERFNKRFEEEMAGSKLGALVKDYMYM